MISLTKQTTVKNKEMRIYSLSWLVQNQKICLSHMELKEGFKEANQEYINQIKNYREGATFDDSPDSLEGCFQKFKGLF